MKTYLKQVEYKSNKTQNKNVKSKIPKSSKEQQKEKIWMDCSSQGIWDKFGHIKLDFKYKHKE